VVFAFGIASACFVGLGLVLQQRVAQRLALSDFLTVRLLWHLARQRAWLLGLGIMVIGQLLGAIALDMGDVSLVEPLLATNLFFALAMARALGGKPLGARGWSGALLLGAGVTLFIMAGNPKPGHAAESTVRHGLVVGIVVGVAALLVMVAKRVNLCEEATLLGAAAGVLFGMQDALTHASAQILGSTGVVGLLGSWQPYGLVAVAAAGQVLMQSAFEAAPLRGSLPSITAAESLAGIACGVGFLGDHLRVTGIALAGEVFGLIGCVLGVIMLGRHPALPSGVAARGEAARGAATTGRLPEQRALPRVPELTGSGPR
jgi:drug/metabolite transporter (DMT)-like permease